MDNSVYIALSRQTALFRKMEAVANNLANVATTGYKADKIMFHDYLVKDGDRRQLAFTHDIADYTDTQSGALKVTGNALDLAISGNGYFMVRTPAGERYTRAGAFTINAEGTLVTPEGYQVLDEGRQPIEFAPEDREITVGEAGNISVNGEERAQIGVVQFANEQQLQRTGDTLFRSPAAPLPAENARVVQGALEQSNVSGVREMTDMITVNRSVGNAAKFIEVMYDLQRKTNTTYTQQSNS